MGKRSREKRERRERGEPTPQKEKPDRGLSNFCLKIIRWGVYLALFTPLIVSGKFFFPFVGPKSLYFMGLVEIIFATWLILVISAPKYRPRFNILLMAIILFVAVLILSTVFGADPSRSFWSNPERMTGLLMWFHLLAFFLVLSSSFRKSQDWIKIFSVSIFAAILVSLLSLFIKLPPNFLAQLGLDFLVQSGRGGATIGNSSFMGTYLLFNIFIGFWLFLNSQNGLKIYSGLSLFIITLALFLSDARAAILSLLGGLVLLSFLYLIFIPQKRFLNLLGKGLLIVSLLVFLVSIFFVFQPDNIIHQKFTEKATKARLVVWEKAWKGFLEKPWLGWGPENFDFVFTKYFNPCMFLSECGGEIWFDRAHNIVLDTLVSTGALGLITYAGIFLSAFYILWAGFFREKTTFWLTAIFSVTLISYFVQNLTVFDMINSYLLFLLVLGFIASLYVKLPESKFQLIDLDIKFKLISIVILILFLFSFFKFVIQPLRTDYYVIAAIKERLGSQERLVLYQKSLEASAWGKYQIREFFARNTLNSLLAEIEKIKKPGEIPTENIIRELDFLSSELEKSIKEAPLDFKSHLRLGEIYNGYSLVGISKASRAQEVLEKAIELSPTNQQGYWILSQTKLYQGKFEEALSLAEKAVELEPRLFQSHQIVIQIAKIMGDSQLIKKKIEEALQINPQWEPELKNILGPEKT